MSLVQNRFVFECVLYGAGGAILGISALVLSGLYRVVGVDLELEGAWAVAFGLGLSVIIPVVFAGATYVEKFAGAGEGWGTPSRMAHLAVGGLALVVGLTRASGSEQRAADEHSALESAADTAHEAAIERAERRRTDINARFDKLAAECLKKAESKDEVGIEPREARIRRRAYQAHGCPTLNADRNKALAAVTDPARRGVEPLDRSAQAVALRSAGPALADFFLTELLAVLAHTFTLIMLAWYDQLRTRVEATRGVRNSRRRVKARLASPAGRVSGLLLPAGQGGGVSTCSPGDRDWAQIPTANDSPGDTIQAKIVHPALVGVDLNQVFGPEEAKKFDVEEGTWRGFLLAARPVRRNSESGRPFRPALCPDFLRSRGVIPGKTIFAGSRDAISLHSKFIEHGLLPS